jgi:hypothetical protein
MSTRLPKLLSLLLLWSALPPRTQAETRTLEIPVSNARAFNQKTVSGKACGPAALLNSFRFGDFHWQKGLKAASGDTDKQRLSSVIQKYGGKPSRSLAGRPRLSPGGINLTDLTDMANDMLAPQGMASLKNQVLVPADGRTTPQWLALTHRRFAASLGRGFPPVICVRRFVWRKTRDGRPAWLALEGHYVTLVRIPAKLPAHAKSFPISYVDPNGGRRCEGIIRVPDEPSPTGLLADFPHTSVGKEQVKLRERSLVVLSSAIGRW